MVFWKLGIWLGRASPWTSNDQEGMLEYLNDMIIEYPSLFIIVTLISIILSLLVVYKIHKQRKGNDLLLLVKSRHLKNKECKSFIP